MKTNYSSRLAFIFSAIALLTFVSCSLMFYSCKKSNPVAPPPSVPDTTSNDFMWSQTPIGTYGTELQDIVAFSDTDVWICGEIHFKDSYTFDSLGHWIVPYNVAHFNGKVWEYIRVEWCDVTASGFYIALAMFGTSSNDMWFKDGGALSYWDGKKFTQWCIPFGTITGGPQLIFKNSNKIYISGSHGSLASFDGTSFTKIATGTDNVLFDVWTVGNKTICATSKWPTGETEPPTLLVIENGQVSRWIDSTMMIGMHGVWFDEHDNILLCSFGVTRWRNPTWIKEYPPSSGYLMHIRGQASNDVFAVGHYGSVDHYNGKYWKHFKEAEPTQSAQLYRLSYIKNNVYIIGQDDHGQFYVFHGKRRR